MKHLKQTWVCIAILLCTKITNAQLAHHNDRIFISVGLDYAIASGSHFLAKSNRVETGNIDYIIQFGIENFTPKKTRFKFGLQYEQFKVINYKAGSVFGGPTFTAPKIPFTNLRLGHFWYSTLELNIISRNGIKDSRLFNSGTLENWALGANMGIRFNRLDIGLFKLPFNIEILFNIKDRPDIRAHYTGRPFTFSKTDFRFSSYIIVSINL